MPTITNSHPKVLVVPFSLAEAKKGLEPYLDNPQFQILVETPEHAASFQEICALLPSARGNFIHDCHYATLLKEHGIQRIMSTDTDFKKFGFLEVINPLVP